MNTPHARSRYLFARVAASAQLFVSGPAAAFAALLLGGSDELLLSHVLLQRALRGRPSAVEEDVGRKKEKKREKKGVTVFCAAFGER